MRAIESNIFWCFVERLAQINNRAVFVSATNEIINQWFLVFSQIKSSNMTIFWASSSFNSSTGIISSLLQTRTLYPTLFDISVNVCSISLYFVAPNFWHTNVFYHNTKVVSSAYGTINLSFQILNYHILTSETCHLACNHTIF